MQLFQSGPCLQVLVQRKQLSVQSFGNAHQMSCWMLLDSDNEVLVWKSDLSIWSPLFNNQFIYTSHNYKHILSQKYDYISYNSHSESLFTASEPQHSPHLLGFRSSLVPKPSAVQKRWSKLHRPGTCCCVLDGRPWIPNKTLKLKYWSEILPDIVLSS